MSGAEQKPPPIPLNGLDLRRNAVREDLAAAKLRGTVTAPAFSDGDPRQVVRSATAVRGRPAASAGFETEAIFGETVVAYDDHDGWSWVQLDRDGYVGYVPTDTLTTDVRPATHRVKALGTFVYPKPDIKSPPLMHLSINAALAVVDADDKFLRLSSGGFVYARHVSERDRFARDYVEIAEWFIGTPYLWGGRTRVAIDCSGLVQVSLEAAGRACPRDSDMQAAEVGTAVDIASGLDNLARGDLVFWAGHVGIMTDAVMLVHANAHQMAVAAETLPEAAERIARSNGGIVAVKRLGEIQA